MEAEELNEMLHAGQIGSKRSGLGLQIVNDLATTLKTTIFYEQGDRDHVSAVVKWEDNGLSV
jgi:two-component sensor histidine kinase